MADAIDSGAAMLLERKRSVLQYSLLLWGISGVIGQSQNSYIIHSGESQDDAWDSTPKPGASE
jgi:hypothetical protein